jgi:uncharacterized protein
VKRSASAAKGALLWAGDGPKLASAIVTLSSAIVFATVTLNRLAGGLAGMLGLDPAQGLGAAVSFFVYELAKVSLLILAISWAMALVRRSLPMEAVRRWLGTGAGRMLGYPAAAGFGAVTPFCSCSSVPLFIGFVEARLPVGIALAFLITSPMVNEIAVALFIASFGWQVAGLYIACGLAIGIGGGWALQRMGAERWLTGFAQQSIRNVAPAEVPVGHCVPAMAGAGPGAHGDLTERCGDAEDSGGPEAESSCCASGPEGSPSRCGDTEPGRVSAWRYAGGEAWSIYRGVLPYLGLALLVGAGIHGFVPENFFATFFGASRWWDVPAAVAVGFPLYASASATVPVLETLVAKGVPLGTGMAFILAAVGVSLPELIILKRVMTIKLLVSFTLVVSVGVMFVGWLFNAVF